MSRFGAIWRHLTLARSVIESIRSGTGIESTRSGTAAAPPAENGRRHLVKSPCASHHGIDVAMDQKLASFQQGQMDLGNGVAGLALRLTQLEKNVSDHLDRQDADRAYRTRSILERIDASAKESRLWASKLFAVLDQR
jgi:hypothetical protein